MHANCGHSSPAAQAAPFTSAKSECRWIQSLCCVGTELVTMKSKAASERMENCLQLQYTERITHPRRGAGVAEQGCLLSSYTPKGCRGFESPPLRHQVCIFSSVPPAAAKARKFGPKQRIFLVPEALIFSLRVPKSQPDRIFLRLQTRGSLPN